MENDKQQQFVSDLQEEITDFKLEANNQLDGCNITDDTIPLEVESLRQQHAKDQKHIDQLKSVVVLQERLKKQDKLIEQEKLRKQDLLKTLKNQIFEELHIEISCLDDDEELSIGDIQKEQAV